MSESIVNGVGSGCFGARVDEDNRLHTGTVSRSERDAAIADGRAFIMSSGLITLTDDVETPIVYLRNNSRDNLYLDIFISTTGLSANGTGNVHLKTYVGGNRSTSTIISEAKPGLVGNANTTSQNTFDGVFYVGETGDTLVDATNFVTFIQQPTTPLETSIRAVLPIDGDASYAFQAPSGNTSMEVSIIISAYYLDTNLPK